MIYFHANFNVKFDEFSFILICDRFSKKDKSSEWNSGEVNGFNVPVVHMYMSIAPHFVLFIK